MLKTAFCVCKLIISSMKKYTLITKLQRRYHPCCEQCFIILSIPICFRSAQYYKYFFVYNTTIYCWNYIPYLHRKRVISPISSPFFKHFVTKNKQNIFLSFSSFVLVYCFLGPQNTCTVNKHPRHTSLGQSIQKNKKKQATYEIFF